MDRISFLPDDFLLQILSLLPTKDVLNTSLLSKRWQFLWKLVPKLAYIDIDEDSNYLRITRFVDRSLLLNTAPVLESVHFKIDRECDDEDIWFWIKTVVEQGLRELNFENCYTIEETIRLPQCLYTCGTLVVLKLKHVTLADVKFPVCFQLLKTLHLVYVEYFDNATPTKLLSSCPILEELVLDRAEDDNVWTFYVMVPTLVRFVYYVGFDSELVMDTPSLKYFKTIDRSDACMNEYMPQIVEAYVQVSCWNTDDKLSSLKPVKRLTLCLPSKPRFPFGSIFYHLVHLEFCTCKTEWDVLMSMLEHSPILRSLKLNEIHDNHPQDPMSHWDEPSSVPETLTCVLETFEWRNYRGWEMERELAKFILKHSECLKIATFCPAATEVKEIYPLITELVRLSRGSAECELVFG